MWYSHIKICIAYLPDILDRKFEDSEWLDRGWTLQELIAPKEVLFFDLHWNSLGTKEERLLEAILSHASTPSTCSIAQRFSWAATRIVSKNREPTILFLKFYGFGYPLYKMPVSLLILLHRAPVDSVLAQTKRVEDRAYSLLGLFDISMPMIYGERENAFIRLQQHIIQKSKDESIFAFPMELPHATSRTYCGFYAPCPSVYIGCNDISQMEGSRGAYERSGELRIRLRIFPHSPGTFRAALNCANRVSPDEKISSSLLLFSANNWARTSLSVWEIT
jgi:hypothetical protein